MDEWAPREERHEDGRRRKSWGGKNEKGKQVKETKGEGKGNRRLREGRVGM